METSRSPLSPLKKLETVIRRALFNIDPAFGKFDRTLFARVLKVNVGGGKVDDAKKAYSVDLQPLLKDLSPDTSFEKIIDVPLVVGTFGNGGVVYCTPKAGTVVRLGFMYSDPSFPYIVGLTGEGLELPDGTADEFRVETPNGVILQIKGEKINFKTKDFNSDLDTVADLLGSLSGIFTSAAVFAGDGGATLKTNLAAATSTWKTKLKSGTL